MKDDNVFEEYANNINKYEKIENQHNIQKM